jgi:hypothetical protein
MASGGIHPGVGVDGAIGVEHAGRNGSAPSRTDVEASLTEELQRALTQLERANDALQRENARLARSVGGQTDSAAAVRLTRAERRWSEDVEAAERRWSEHAEAAERRWSEDGAAAERRWRERVEAAELEVERLSRLLATPRHRAVERARETLIRSRFLYPPVRGIWALVAKILRLQR